MKDPELSQTEAEHVLMQIAREAGAGAPGTQLACLRHERVAYFARHRPVMPHEPHSALTRLVQGIYDARPESALHLVRHRIFVNYELSERCRGLLKVAARRVSPPLTPCDHAIDLKVELRELAGLGPESQRVQLEGAGEQPLSLWTERAPPESDEDFLGLAARLAATVTREPATKLIAQDRAIAALLVAPDGRLLSWGVNRITRNRTLHAELNAAQRYWQRNQQPLPKGTRIYSTLKACRMCAGMLWDLAAEPRSLVVRYTEFDPGPNARETVFNQKGLAIERQVP